MTRWRWAALAGVVAAVVLLGFGALPGSEACRQLTGQPWADFQQSGGVARAAQLIATCGPSLRTGMAYDALVFIPAFTLFLTLSLWALRPPRAVEVAGALLVAAGALADQAEGFRLLAMIQTGVTDAAVASAAQATWLKVLLLSLATGAIAAVLLNAGGWRRIAGVVAVGGALASALGAGNAGLGLAWLTLMLVALAGASRPEATHG